MKKKVMTWEQRVKAIRTSLELLCEDDSIAELRVPNSDDGPQSGLFDDLDEMADVAAEIGRKVPGVYATMNPVQDSLRDRVKNRLAATSSAVKDGNIDCRRWLLLDFDPARPSKSPSTDAEHEEAIAAAKRCRDALRELGWPEGVLADSGNGSHVLFRIDLANDEATAELVRNCLLALALRHSTPAVVLDTTTANASRLTRLYGTMNKKGEETTDRRYRRSRLLDMPKKIEIVSEKQLAEVAAALPITGTERIGQQFDIEKWLEKYEVQIAFDADWKDGGHKWILSRCPWNSTHRKTAVILRFPNGGIAASCLHKSCAGKNWPQLREVFEVKTAEARELSPKALPEFGERKQGQATQLIQSATPNLRLFRTPQGEAYATMVFEDHDEHHTARSNAFREYLNRIFYGATKTAPQPSALSQAVAHFTAAANFDGAVKPIFIRVGDADGRSYLDLANNQWQAIEFSAEGWSVKEKPPIRFRRARGMFPLPQPERGGDINDLRQFLNLRTDGDWVLFVACHINGILPRGPYPVLGLSGEAGSGKTTMARLHRKLVDPNSSPARSGPKDERDLMVSAVNGWVLCFDNLSFIPVWLSDAFCRLSTGGGITRRLLYSDADEFIYDGQRPVVVNGIEQLPTRADLLDRCVLLDLPVIRNYEPEADFWAKFDRAHPQLLGALLDVTVGTLQNLPAVKLALQPRMADFARLGTAAESALKLPRGTFMAAYTRNKRDATTVALEACPFANQIIELAKKGWKSPAAALLEYLERTVDEETRKRRSWPKAANVLSGMLKRLAPAFRTVGVEVETDNRDNTSNRNKSIVLRQARSTARKE